MEQYLESTRSPWYSLVFILPLWLLYEVMEALVGHGVINGADAMLEQAISIFGVHGRLAAEGLLALGIAVWVYRIDARHREAGTKPAWLAGMLAESVVYAACFGGLVIYLMRLILPGGAFALDGLSVGQQFVTSLGAGVFEELLFRVMLMGGLTWLGVHVCKLNNTVSLVISILLSSVIFSGFHYVGSLGDSFSFYSFMFRFISGVVLAVLYRARGFGVAACTHSIYDLLVLLHG